MTADECDGIFPIVSGKKRVRVEAVQQSHIGRDAIAIDFISISRHRPGDFFDGARHVGCIVKLQIVVRLIEMCFSFSEYGKNVANDFMAWSIEAVSRR